MARVPDLLLILIIVLVLVVLWRGPKTLPRLGEAFGRGVRAARREASDATGSMDDETPSPPPATPNA